jgi:hypothetical protein
VWWSELLHYMFFDIKGGYVHMDIASLHNNTPDVSQRMLQSQEPSILSVLTLSPFVVDQHTDTGTWGAQTQQQ